MTGTQQKSITGIIENINTVAQQKNNPTLVLIADYCALVAEPRNPGFCTIWIQRDTFTMMDQGWVSIPCSVSDATCSCSDVRISVNTTGPVSVLTGLRRAVSVEYANTLSAGLWPQSKRS